MMVMLTGCAVESAPDSDDDAESPVVHVAPQGQASPCPAGSICQGADHQQSSSWDHRAAKPSCQYDKGAFAGSPDAMLAGDDDTSPGTHDTQPCAIPVPF